MLDRLINGSLKIVIMVVVLLLNATYTTKGADKLQLFLILKFLQVIHIFYQFLKISKKDMLTIFVLGVVMVALQYFKTTSVFRKIIDVMVHIPNLLHIHRGQRICLLILQRGLKKLFLSN